MKIHANGTEENRIVGAVGAIPYIENLSEENIARFKEQVEAVDLIGSEDDAKITAKIKELAGKDPGALDAEPMIVVLSEEGEEGEEFEGIRPMAAEVAMIQARTRMIQTQIADMGNLNKFASGVYSGKIEGAMIGIVLSLGLLGLLILGGGV